MARCHTDYFTATHDNLEEIITQVGYVIKRHPYLTFKDFEFDVEEDYGSQYVRVSYVRDEEPHEEERRLKQEEESRRRREEWDRKNYEELKKKFGEK